MLKVCNYCNKIHDNKKKCKKRGYYREYNKNKNYNKVIKSKRWRVLSDEIKRLDGFSCLVCRSLGLFSPVYLEAHHIEKVRECERLAFDTCNIVTLCVYHHKQADSGAISKVFLYELIAKYRK